MIPSSLGDMSRHYQTLSENRTLRTRMYRLNDELSSGRHADMAKALRGDQVRLGDIASRISVARARVDGANESGMMLGIMQSAMGRVDAARENLASRVLQIGSEPSDEQIASAAAGGREALDAVVTALNSGFAGQSLFAGTATGTPPLADAETILAGVRAEIAASGATTAADVETVVNDWFAPGGGFFATAYVGDTGAPLTRRVDDGAAVSVEPRADRAEFREIMAAAVRVAVSADIAPALDRHERAGMLKGAADGLLGSSLSLTELRGRLGSVEARVEEAVVQQEAEIASLSILYNELTQVDPHETAVALQEAQLKLETHYTLIARLSRLTLSEYL